ncbi:MAG TPA: leucyl aminopeptidase, partial [Nitrospira sp.]|nr:leucyl aminopeptidase [Nitrospira sp.]
MDIMRVHAKHGCVDTDRTEALVILLCEDDSLATSDGAVLDRALGGALRELQRSREFEGKLHEVMLLHTHGKLPAKRLI